MEGERGTLVASNLESTHLEATYWRREASAEDNKMIQPSVFNRPGFSGSKGRPPAVVARIRRRRVEM